MVDLLDFIAFMGFIAFSVFEPAPFIAFIAFMAAMAFIGNTCYNGGGLQKCGIKCGFLEVHGDGPRQ